MPDEITRETVREAVARAIFEHWQFYPGDAKKPAWLDEGNSLRQDEARSFARAALSALAALGLAVVPEATLRAMQEASTDTPEPEDAERALTAIYEMTEALLLAASPLKEAARDGE